MIFNLSIHSKLSKEEGDFLQGCNNYLPPVKKISFNNKNIELDVFKKDYDVSYKFIFFLSNRENYIATYSVGKTDEMIDSGVASNMFQLQNVIKSYVGGS